MKIHELWASAMTEHCRVPSDERFQTKDLMQPGCNDSTGRFLPRSPVVRGYLLPVWRPSLIVKE